MLRQWYYQNKLIINSVFLVTLTGMVFLYPFYQSHFRVTLGVPVLAALLMYFQKLPIIKTSVFSGIAIFAGRSAIFLFLGTSEFMDAVYHNLPAIIYYLVFGICFTVFNIRGFLQQVPVLILLLSTTDILSNCIELLIRSEPVPQNIETMLVTIAAVAIIRSGIAILGYYALKQYRDFALAEDRLSRYAELTVMIAQLKSELYYLQKSSQDIENVMAQSYSLYQELSRNHDKKNKEKARQALTVAREIHEVKKDYYRVSKGIEKVLEPSAIENGMHLSEIFFIIEQNARRSLREDAKQLDIHMSLENDFLTDKHYTIVSILNNLIVNAIEACDNVCNITVTQERISNDIKFTVSDNGHGIKEQDYELIFEPGYSTKYCLQTGQMSTGLGLSHVKNLVSYLDGKVEIRANQGKGTQFIIILPLDSIVIKF